MPRKSRLKKKVSKKSTKKIVKKRRHVKKSISFAKNKNAFVGLIVLVAIVAWFLFIPNESNISKTSNSDADAVLDLYVMSQCPYGAQAESEAIKAVERLGEDVALNIYYIVNSQGVRFNSLHGQPEVDENIRQLCIKENQPELLYDYLLCFNENYGAGESQYNSCASQVGIDTSKVDSCINDEGTELLRASEAETNKVGASSSPTIYLNKQPYAGGRSEMDFAREICSKLNYEIEGCSDIPKPVSFELIVLTSDDCTSCDTTQILSVSKQLFPGVRFRTVQADSDEGQQLIAEHQLVYLPSYIFDSKVTETSTWNTNTQIVAAFKESGSGFRLRDETTGATWFISEEKRADSYAKIGVVKGDNKPQIDFFIMSYCPYGNQAEEAIEPAYQELKNKADFKPHYVIYSNYGSGYPEFCMDEENKICSMHGIQELNQDIREACTAKYYGMDEWFSFALAMNNQCSDQNADTCWVNVAESLDLDTEQISSCEKNEGYELMSADKELGDILGVRGSPSIFVDGDKYSGSRTANGYLGSLCVAFENAPIECEGKIQEPTRQAVPSGACG
ncbi:hypothetical protein CMO90_03295 [Candidatus Woesearchaeota archaeon]|nr:hypothetical protein [Candidatus Woesearchaeota archaeon]